MEQLREALKTALQKQQLEIYNKKKEDIMCYIPILTGIKPVVEVVEKSIKITSLGKIGKISLTVEQPKIEDFFPIQIGTSIEDLGSANSHFWLIFVKSSGKLLPFKESSQVQTEHCTMGVVNLVDFNGGVFLRKIFDSPVTL